MAGFRLRTIEPMLTHVGVTNAETVFTAPSGDR